MPSESRRNQGTKTNELIKLYNKKAYVKETNELINYITKKDKQK